LIEANALPLSQFRQPTKPNRQHAQNFVDPNHPEVNTQAAEGLWLQAKRKLRYQSGTSRALFPSYLDAFQWRFSHKIHPFWATFEIAE